ncbi:MAG: toll/interleukin-1 receptor domain-containing protein [Gemmatimonadota bacterium]|nr:MAG: toll/interleukin-1 receptor domain-containing protein [Gemmatimonadota bacterium]
MNAVFISYRREDGGYAGRLYSDLSARFGERQIFMDVDDIVPGRPFPREVMDALLSCRVVLAVVGERWRSQANLERLNDPNDWVLQELKTALTREVAVIPLLVGGTKVPREEELPPDLAPLSRREAFEVRDSAWQDDVRRLIDTLQRHFGVRRERSPWARRIARLLAVGAVAALAYLGARSGLFPRPGPGPGPRVIAATLTTVPLSLLNSMQENPDLYWFKFSGVNPGESKAFLKVRFEVAGPVMIVGRDGEEEQTFDLPPGSSWTTEEVPVNLTVLNYDKRGSVTVEWQIETADGRPLDAHATNITLLPANTVKWDLKTRRFEGDAPIEVSFPTDYLLASLAAWTVTENDSVRTRARELYEQSGAQVQSLRDWYARLYTAFFNDSEERILIRSPEPDFPPSGERDIHTAVQVLRDPVHTAEPLEVVLFLSALTRAAPIPARVRLAMVVAPSTESLDEKVFFLAWLESGEWHALEVSGSGTRRTFEDNERLATQRIRALQQSLPALFDSLDASGIFYQPGETSIAVDFDKALESYRIRPLPYDG